MAENRRYPRRSALAEPGSVSRGGDRAPRPGPVQGGTRPVRPKMVLGSPAGWAGAPGGAGGRLRCRPLVLVSPPPAGLGDQHGGYLS